MLTVGLQVLRDRPVRLAPIPISMQCCLPVICNVGKPSREEAPVWKGLHKLPWRLLVCVPANGGSKTDGNTN
jgi:hypothetical protein